MTRLSEITTEVTNDAAVTAGTIKRAAQSVWKGARAFGEASPRIVAALLLITAATMPPMVYFGVVAVPKPDAALQTQLNGAGLAIQRIDADMETLATKGDTAALAARIRELEARTPALAPVTTGLISKSKR